MNKSYPFKVWITSLSIGAVFVLLHLSLPFEDGVSSDFPLFCLYLFLFGLVVSLPVFLLYFLACIGLMYLGLSEITIKLLLALVAIAGMWLIFYYVIGNDIFSTTAEFGIGVPIFYSLSITVASLTFRFKRL